MTDAFHNEDGRIQNQDVAHEVADLAKPAYDRELQLKKEAEGGLTTEQSANLEIVDGLEQKYPNAFEVKIDDKGRKILFANIPRDSLRTIGVNTPKELVFSQEGFIGIDSVNPELKTEDLDMTAFIDRISDKKDEFDSHYHSTGFESHIVLSNSGNAKVETPSISVSKLDISDSNTQQTLKHLLRATDFAGKNTAPKNGEVKPQDILANL